MAIGILARCFPSSKEIMSFLYIGYAGFLTTVLPFSSFMLPLQADSCCLQPVALNKINDKIKDGVTKAGA